MVLVTKVVTSVVKLPEMGSEKLENSQPNSKPQSKPYGKIVLSLHNCLLPPEKLQHTPSQLEGLDSETETDLRILGCELIQTAGILLRLPQVAMATGQVLFQRFYYSKSFIKNPMETTAMGCLCLASKVEEAPMRIRDIINVFHHIKQVNNQNSLVTASAGAILKEQFSNILKSPQCSHLPSALSKFYSDVTLSSLMDLFIENAFHSRASHKSWVSCARPAKVGLWGEERWSPAAENSRVMDKATQH